MIKMMKSLLMPIFGWPLYLMSHYMPRDSKKFVFGVNGSNFTGNVAALYLDENFQDGCLKVFIYRTRALRRCLDTISISGNYQYYSIYSAKGIYHALTAGCYVYSNYLSDISFWMSKGARAFNVWHGTPLKTIERDIEVGKYSAKNRWENILRYVYPYFYVRPDKMLVSSDYEKQCFKTAFNLKENTKYIYSFPPRLGVVLDNIKTSEKDIVLYCPTWRDDHSFTFQETVDVDKLNKLMRQLNLTFIIKPHSSDKSLHLSGKFSNIQLVSSSIDIYSYLTKSIAVVSDYSSMLFDAAYCNIPVVLFCPDAEQYQKNNREFYTPIQNLGLPIVTTGINFLEKIRNVKSWNFSYESNVYFDVYKSRSINL